MAAKALHKSSGKPRVEDVPYSLVRGVGEVLRWAEGKKYARDNWRKGTEWREFAGSALRHLRAWLEAEDDDRESGLNHLKHAATNIAFLLEYQERGLGTDDRYRYEETKA